MNPRILFSVIAMICISWNSYAQSGVEFRDDYWLEKALQIAKIEDKHIFIDTYTPWCGPCKLMDIQFQDPELGSFFNKHYINIKVNMDSGYGAAIKSKYDVFFLPTLLIIDKNGKVKYASDGIMTSDELLSFGKHFYNESYNPSGVVLQHEVVVATPVEKIQELKQFKISEADLSQKKEEVAEHLPVTAEDVNEETPVAPAKEIKSSKKVTINSVTTISPELKEQERILYTQNDQAKDPEFLFNYTYLKLQLQDGTHSAAAEEYLATQKDWSTLKNMRFIYDFVRRPGTKMFDHLIDNRVDYDILFGKENVDRSISIMINMYLYQGFPRPTPEESLELFQLLDRDVAEQATYNYLLERYEMDEDFKSYVPLALDYVKKIDPDDFAVINKIAVYYESAETNLNVNQLIKMMEHAIEVQGGSYYVLYDTIAGLYFKKGKKKKAVEAIENAIRLAKNSGVDTSDIIQLQTMIKGM